MAVNSPLGEESIFYVPETVDASPVATAYQHYIEVRTSGLDVFETYKKATVATNEIIIFFETNVVKDVYGNHQQKTNNLFGTVCLVKIGSDYVKNIINKVNAGYEVSILNQDIVRQTVRSLNEYCGALEEIYPEKILDSTSLFNAIQMELQSPNAVESILSDIYKSNADFSDWIGMGITKLEEWKLTEENYDYEKHYLVPSLNKKRGVEPQEITYRPIIPVPVQISGKSYMVSNAGTYAEIKHLVETFTETILGAVDDLVKTTPNQVDDKAWAFVKELFIKLNDTISGFLGPIYEKLKELLAGVFTFIEQLIKLVGDFVTGSLALINAIVCGIVNGLISIVQTVLSVVELVSKVTPLNLVAQMLPENLAKNRETMELIEDTIDMLTENASAIFSGLVDTLTDKETWKQLSAFISSLWRKFTDQTNEYFWAYIVGAIVFEVIVEILLAVATSGGSAVASISGRISRATTKAQALFRKGAQAAKTAGKVIGKAAIDILQWLRKEIAELIEAIKNKRFVEWLRYKLNSVFGMEVKPSQADLLADWGKVAGRGRRLGQILKKADIAAIRTYLKKQGVDLELFPEKGEYTIEGFFIRKDVPATMAEGAQAQFIYTDKQMKICLRDGSTVYEFLHELTHMKHAKSIGLESYYKMGGYGTPGELVKEKYVFDKIIESKDLMTKSELIDAKNYINRIKRFFGENPISFNFDIDKVPEVRKEIKINEILK